jgi:hypothetical protein
MTNMRTVVYRGGPRGVGMLAQMLREEGVEARYDPPVEQRGMAESVAAGVTVYYLCQGGDAAIRAAVRKFRERFGERAAQIEIHGDDE